MKSLILVSLVFVSMSQSFAATFKIGCSYDFAEVKSVNHQNGHTAVKVKLVEESSDGVFEIVKSYLIEGTFAKSQLEANLEVVKLGWFPKCVLNIDTL